MEQRGNGDHSPQGQDELTIVGRRVSSQGLNLGYDMVPALNPLGTPLFMTPKTARDVAPRAVEEFEVREGRNTSQQILHQADYTFPVLFRVRFCQPALASFWGDKTASKFGINGPRKPKCIAVGSISVGQMRYIYDNCNLLCEVCMKSELL